MRFVDHSQKEHDKKSLYVHLRDSYKGWQFYPHVQLELIPHFMQVRLSEPNGMTLDFRLTGPGFSKTSLASPPYGISNTVGDTPSGKYDPRNTRISYEENGRKIVVYAADGTTRIYRKKGFASKNSFLYLLEKEILPNGKLLKYHYNKRNQLHTIESLDPKERHIYSSLFITGTPWDDHCHFLSSSGLTADYHYEQRPIQWEFKEKSKRGGKNKEIGNTTSPPILTSVSSPSYRQESLEYCGKFLLGAYSGKEETFTTVYTGFGEGSKHYRVHKLQFPVGQNDSFQPVYELSYDPPIAGYRQGTTTVKNSDGTSTIYHFSKNLLTTLIQYFRQDQTLHKEKTFSWDENNRLNTLEIKDHQKNILYKKTFQYDPFGNPIIETLTGDLTGEGTPETFTTKRTFSQEGKNLLLQEETEEGKIISFTYLPNTNLITTKLTKEGDQILLREFFLYDDSNNLIQTITDDGTSPDKDNLTQVNQRTLKTYTLRQTPPHLHMPEWIEETYLENKTEQPLKKSHLIYDQQGNISQEEIYDAEGKLAYTISKTHNERGDILTQTNPLGQQATYTYDSRGNYETATNFSNRIQKTFHHDKKGRLRLKSMVDETQEITISRQVDPFGNVLQEIFPNNLEINKEYDHFNRLISLRMGNQGEVLYTYDPLFLRTVTRASPTGDILYQHSYKDYDQDGNLVSENLIGNLGQVTHATDVRGQKTLISSPYFSEECAYDQVGNLISNSIDRAERHYSYDGLSQLSSEKSRNHSLTYLHDSLYNRTQKNGVVHQVNELNELLSFENGHCAYDLNGNQILRQTPSETFCFTYDPLNRLVEIVSEKQKLNFIYDPLGRRLSKIVYTQTVYGWKETDRENYLYDDQYEIGAFTESNQPKNFRVLGLNFHEGYPATVAVEIEGQPFAPLLDVQGNIRCLVDPDTKTIVNSYDFTAFGELNDLGYTDPFNPWRFASKRFDPELGLIYFGRRYYDPRLGRWLTTDPAGFVDSFNLYQYALNNPFRYYDPQGESLGGFLCGIGQIIAGGVIMATGIALQVGTFGGYTFAIGFHEAAGFALLSSGLATASYHMKDVSFPNKTELPSTRSQEYLSNGLITIPVAEGYGDITRIEKNDGPPINNSDQNKQAGDARKQIEREIGRKLNPKEERQFHDHITGQGYGYHELVDEGIGLFGGK